MADNETQQNQQNQQGQERAEAHEPDQEAQDQGQGRAGAQEPNTEADDLAAETDVAKLRHEAASRRRQLRAAEAERDQLRERVDTHDRAEVERLVAAALADPTDVWGAVELDALREGGAVDAAKVNESVAALLEAKPHYALDRPRVDLHQGVRQTERQAPSFGQALKSGGGRQ
jgi:hypothetical protein